MLIADLHIHSKYSRATSGECVPEHLDLWARRKGIGLLGTGDFTHPAWRQELRDKLVPAEEGLYTLREGLHVEGAAGTERPRFVVTGEISSIYKKDGRVRKVHNLILLPGLEAAEALSKKLEAIGNIHSDGRPILGLDSRDLLEITMETCPEAVFIPAHIWTPHFSLFGAFSGFDTIEACFGDMTPCIHAVETGLSSDPPMNWRLSALDRYALVSNSDAHSPSKLGREANLLEIEPSYPALASALRGRGAPGFRGTVEFFPEEGKYHFDGHRNCKLCLRPGDTPADGRCPVCGGKLTIGVLHRVEELADREEGFVPQDSVPFQSLVPLPEVIAACTGFGPASSRVTARYEALLRELGPEFTILREVPEEEIGRVAGPAVAEGVRRMRRGQVELSPGYDGEYGKIKLLDPQEIETLAGQMSLFGSSSRSAPKKKAPAAPRPARAAQKAEEVSAAPPEGGALAGLNEEQRAAVTAAEPAVAVVAGPGTGKTKTLVARVAWLVGQGVKPAQITAVTFTNKAAGEMRERLEALFGKRAVRAMTIGTFHAICLRLLSERGPVSLIGEGEALAAASEVIGALDLRLSARKLVQEVSRRKGGLPADGSVPVEACERYCELLKEAGVRDYDDLLLDAYDLFVHGEATAKERRAFTHLLVDEFQDVSDVQYRLVRAWSGESAGVFVIGDPDQSIYGFRGSDARCFARFAADWPAAKTVVLTRNYRSTPQILRASLPVISKNGGPERTLEAQRPDGGPVRLVTAADEFSEAIFVAKEINRLVGGIDMLDAQGGGSAQPRGFSDFAVLYRTHRQAEALEKCLGIEGIPYLVAGRDKLLSDGLVRGAVGFFRGLCGSADPFSLRACLTESLGCERAAADAFLRTAAGAAADSPVRLLELLPPALAAAEPLVRWAELAEKYLPRARREKPRRLLEGWIEDTGRSSPAMERLLNMAVLHADMPAFLLNLTLGEERDVARSGSRAYLSDVVTLLTLHGAKGLEFPVVFLCGAKRGMLPLDSPGRSNDPAEERRLFYVGMTRAREELVLLCPGEPSPFLADIPADQLARSHATPARRPAPGGVQLSFFQGNF